MKKTVKTKKDILSFLLSGQYPQAEKYAGHHVLVVKDQIVPLKKGKEAIKDIDYLEKKYGETPTIVFVPRKDISYILVLLRSKKFTLCQP